MTLAYRLGRRGVLVYLTEDELELIAAAAQAVAFEEKGEIRRGVTRSRFIGSAALTAASGAQTCPTCQGFVGVLEDLKGDRG